MQMYDELSSLEIPSSPPKCDKNEEKLVTSFSANIGVRLGLFLDSLVLTGKYWALIVFCIKMLRNSMC